MAARSKSIALYLKQAREKAKLSQREVADELGYQSAQFISTWERGISIPPVRAWKRLGELYRLPADALYEILLPEILGRVRDDLYRAWHRASKVRGKRK